MLFFRRIASRHNPVYGTLHQFRNMQFRVNSDFCGGYFRVSFFTAELPGLADGRKPRGCRRIIFKDIQGVFAGMKPLATCCNWAIHLIGFPDLILKWIVTAMAGKVIVKSFVGNNLIIMHFLCRRFDDFCCLAHDMLLVLKI